MQQSGNIGIPKWLLTAPLAMLALVLMVGALPLTLPITFLLSLFPAYRGAVRALLFLFCYLGCETIGIIVSAWIWLRHSRNSARFQSANFKLQCWWANALMRCAATLFSLKFHLHNLQATEGAGAIMLPRHTSIADTVLPMVYYAIPQNARLRYVLKKELLWDPCLEIVGNRLPNYFVDRASLSSDTEIARVVELLADAPSNEGLLLYPEGTRYTPSKYASLQAKAEAGSELAQQLKRWPNLLPPRLGGCLGLLGSNKEHDLLFMAHTGFGGSANFVELMNGSWSHSDVHLEFWRVPFEDIPTEQNAQREFLFSQWDRMQSTVLRLQSL